MRPDQADDLLDAMARARNVLGNHGPSPNLRVRLQEAANELSVAPSWERFVDHAGKLRWRAGVFTQRGPAFVDVEPGEGDEPWEAAFSELGLLD